MVLKDLKNQPFIHTIRSGSVWQHVQPLLHTAGTVDTGLEVCQLGTLGGLVAQGFGISIVPRFALTLCLRADVVAVPIQDKKAVRPIYLINRKHHSLSAAEQSVYDILLSEATARQKSRTGMLHSLRTVKIRSSALCCPAWARKVRRRERS